MTTEHWKIIWHIDNYQVGITTEFYNTHKDNIYVKTRYRRNVQKIGLDFSKEFIWKSIISCLLTTQQKSGPNSKVAQFLRTDPFLLNLPFCLDNLKHLDIVGLEIFQKFGGLRRTSVIANQLKTNLQKLIESDWELLKQIKEQDLEGNNSDMEKSLADTIQNEIAGYGPKQSRNFLQILGVTKYEIPLDSRIIDWLNNHNFPIHLTGSGLSDKYYYQFIISGIQELCRKADIYPCLLDAAIFSSYDKDKWTVENSVF